MARREPIDLIIAKGRKHLTKAEIEERRSQELSVPFKDVKPPEYLSESQKREFMEYARKLLALGIFTELDEDCLAQYVLSKNLYLGYTAKLTALMKTKKYDEIAKVQQMQDKAFRQSQTCANALALNISSRCKLVIPNGGAEEDYEL